MQRKRKYTHLKSLHILVFTDSLLPLSDHITTSHLSIQKVTILVYVLNRLLRNTVTLLLPWQCWVRENTGAGVWCGGAFDGRTLLVLWTLGQRDVNGRGRVCERLAGGLVLSRLGQSGVRRTEIRQLVVGGSGSYFCALCVHVEVGDLVRVQLAVYTDDLVVQVLG